MTTHPPINIRSKGQRVKSQGHKVKKAIKRLAYVMHSMPVVYSATFEQINVCNQTETPTRGNHDRGQNPPGQAYRSFSSYQSIILLDYGKQ